MDVIYRLDRAAVQDVLAELEDPPSYSAVRAMLRILEEKGHLKHTEDGNRYIYQPTQPKDAARRSALKHLLDTFFDDSVEHAVAALLDVKKRELSEEELTRLRELIDDARKQGR
jgi:predicted transcriptional regulator